LKRADFAGEIGHMSLKPLIGLPAVRSETTSAEMTTSPPVRPRKSAGNTEAYQAIGALDCALDECGCAFASPAPITTGKPAARAIFASAARPEVQSTVDNRWHAQSPFAHDFEAGLLNSPPAGLSWLVRL